MKDALFLANHPARKGLDSPHEIRALARRASRGIALGMEGAPGHQAAGISRRIGPGSGRGFYDNCPTADCFPAYPLESYRTWGGFDWMTATVGGLWDSLLAEGKPVVDHRELRLAHRLPRRLDPPAGADTTATSTPTAATATRCTADGPATANGDYWPGYYSRTHVGAERLLLRRGHATGSAPAGSGSTTAA